jgi:hypothetical protein
MSRMGRAFAGPMPEFYDRFLVPFMFAPFAHDMADRLSGMTSGMCWSLRRALAP